LVLLIVAAVFGLDLLWKNTFSVNDTVVFGQSLGIHTARGFFLIGVITGAVLLLGVSLILSGIHRKGRKVIQRRKDKKETGKTHEDRDQLAADNADLRDQLDDKHTSPAPAQGEQRATVVSEDSSRAGATKAW
jgi:hypothetical protein